MKTSGDRRKMIYNILVISMLALAIGATVYLKRDQGTPDQDANTSNEAPMVNKPDKAPESPEESLPRLVDLGADKCIPCKMMAPILENLKEEYKDRFEVEFIDVWKNPDAGKQYGIKLIPTQIFFDSSGKEVFRHEGFFSKEDILAKWKDLGVTLKEASRESEENTL